MGYAIITRIPLRLIVHLADIVRYYRLLAKSNNIISRMLGITSFRYYGHTTAAYRNPRNARIIKR
jgi:hypothetical protein